MNPFPFPFTQIYLNRLLPLGPLGSEDCGRNYKNIKRPTAGAHPKNDGK